MKVSQKILSAVLSGATSANAMQHIRSLLCCSTNDVQPTHKALKDLKRHSRRHVRAPPNASQTKKKGDHNFEIGWMKGAADSYQEAIKIFESLGKQSLPQDLVEGMRIKNHLCDLVEQHGQLASKAIDVSNKTDEDIGRELRQLQSQGVVFVQVVGERDLPPIVGHSAIYINQEVIELSTHFDNHRGYEPLCLVRTPLGDGFLLSKLIHLAKTHRLFLFDKRYQQPFATAIETEANLRPGLLSCSITSKWFDWYELEHYQPFGLQSNCNLFTSRVIQHAVDKVAASPSA